jgi:RimJ/RimL family protein N-acetyltransferase
MRLDSERLILRPVQEADVSVLHPLVDDADVAATMLSTPHPYPEGELRDFILKAIKSLDRRERYEMTIVLKETGLPIGAIRFFHIDWEHSRTEMGCWLGKQYWGRGYATEATARMVRFGFEELGLEGIHAHCLASNAASARVLEKAGLALEGTIRHAARKADEFHDVLLYGIIREDYDG